MPVFQRSFKTIQATDDGPGTLGAGQDTEVLTWDNGAGHFVMSPGGGGTSDHAALSNLDYASSGHRGFAGTDTKNSFTQAQAFGVLYRLGGDVTDGGSMDNGDPPGGFVYDPSVTASASNDAYSGSQSMRLELSEANKGATQNESAAPGTMYRCQVFAKAISGTAKLSIYEDADGSAV